MHRRIKEVRKALGVKQKDVAKRLGVSQGHLCVVESGSQNPSDLFINAFCSIYGVNQIWLRSGDGDMFEAVKCPYLQRGIQ